MIDGSSTLLLCFYGNEKRKCRSLTRRNDGELGDINGFVFDSEFEIDKVDIPDSTHGHYYATIANYQGFPLILGGYDHGMGNNKLEMLNVMENNPSWIEGTDYPYSDT